MALRYDGHGPLPTPEAGVDVAVKADGSPGDDESPEETSETEEYAPDDHHSEEFPERTSDEEAPASLKERAVHTLGAVPGGAKTLIVMVLVIGLAVAVGWVAVMLKTWNTPSGDTTNADQGPTNGAEGTGNGPNPSDTVTSPPAAAPALPPATTEPERTTTTAPSPATITVDATRCTRENITVELKDGVYSLVLNDCVKDTLRAD